MTPSQFDDCLSIVGPLLQKYSHREPLSPGQRLAMTLRYLSRGDSIFSIASGYKVGRSTASTVIKETTKALWTALNEIVLKPLTLEDIKTIEQGFLERWNFPHALGVLDGKHISINHPNNSESIVLLAMCDAHYNFTYIDVGVCDSQSDVGVLANSTLLQALQNGNIPLPDDDFLPGSEINMPHFIIGDDAFSLGKHLMRPYKERNLTTEQAIFNYRLSRARRVIENAFGILVARWQIFTKTISVSTETVGNIVKATMCLHNFIKKREYAIPENNKKYCPIAYCDRETNDGVLPGEWRASVGSNFNAVLQEVAKTGKRGNNPGKNALILRKKLTQYLISPAGALPDQIDSINRGRIIQ